MAQPLQGLRIVDLSKDFAGPFCTMILSDLGAKVVKVEKPGTGDETRAWSSLCQGRERIFPRPQQGKKEHHSQP